MPIDPDILTKYKFPSLEVKHDNDTPKDQKASKPAQA